MTRPTLALWAVVGILFIAGLSRANVINARSGSYSDVSAAVASANPGDTVYIPSGKNIWTQSLGITGITLEGSGTNNTIIVDETPITGLGLPIFTLNTASTLTRITELTVTVGVTNSYPAVSVQAGNQSAATRGNINVTGTNAFRIDHCVFYYLTGKPIHVMSMNFGLIDHCSFEMYAGANAIEVDGGVDSDGGMGDYSWSIPYAYGSSNALFIENNSISSAFQFSAIDVSNGGRCVIRNNSFLGSFVYTHGTESGQRFRSVRVVEVYSNSFQFSTTVFDNGSSAITIRGGTGLIFNNWVTNFYNVASIQDYRTTDNSPYFTPWWGATGLNGYDSNSVTLLSGTASVTTNVLIVNGANWTSNQWYGCTVYNPNKNLCGIVTINNANTMWFLSSASPGLQLNFTAGDPFVVHLVYPQLDQPGRGYGNLMTNLPNSGAPAAVWPNQVSEPIYIWNNYLNRNYIPTVVAPGYSAYPDIALGRDLINSPKPGYVPFVYPHPLESIVDAVNDSTNNASGTNSLTTTNTYTPTNTLQPPTGLNVQPL